MTEEFTLDSECLGCRRVIRLHLPDSDGTSCPTVYFHHGLGFDGSSPWTETGLKRVAEGYRINIVTADAEEGWFVNDVQGGRLWEDFFAFELPEWVEERFPALRSREARGQCGYSMGGYGAMMLTLLHPDRFSAVSTLCGSFLFGHEYRKDRPERNIYMKTVAPPGGRYDLFRLAGEELGSVPDLPFIRMDIGRDDYLLEQHRKFHLCLTENRIRHEYSENEGRHSWSYVDSRLEASLAFFADHLSGA